MHVTVLLTCFNRRNATLACLDSIVHSWPDGVDRSVFLVDDASTDGTGEAVRAAFPGVMVIDGPGDLFWCRGMHRAWTAASRVPADADLWVNDDVVLDEDALKTMIGCFRDQSAAVGTPAVLVGTMVDPDTGEVTYGGHRAVSGWHPGRLMQVPVVDAPTKVDTFNGNLVLVPRTVSGVVGTIDPTYSHAMGDTDYGLRTTRGGFDVFVVPGIAGTCARNPPVAHSFRTYIGRKGLPWRSWLHFTRRFTRRGLWPVTFAAPYVKFLCRRIRRSSPP